MCEATNQLKMWVIPAIGGLDTSLTALFLRLTTRTVAEIQRKIIKKGKRNAISQLFHAKDDQGAIAAWRSELNRTLHVFNVRFGVVVGRIDDRLLSDDSAYRLSLR